MSDLTEEHLKNAKYLLDQGLEREAIAEYVQVLRFEPTNIEAMTALKELDVDIKQATGNPRATYSSLKTDFFVNQAKESNSSILKRGPIKIIMCLIAVCSIWALYSGTMYIINFDSIKASENVAIRFFKPRQTNNNSYVDLEIRNLNPGPIRNIRIGYRVLDKNGLELKSGKLFISTKIPAGATRTFDQLELGIIDGLAARLQPILTTLQYGPSPKISPELKEKFIEASAKPDSENLEDFMQIADAASNFAPGYIGLASAYAAKDNWRQAIEIYKQAIDIDPENSDAHYCLGVAYYYNHDKDSAIKEIKEAERLSPDDPDITRSIHNFSAPDKTKSKSK